MPAWTDRILYTTALDKDDKPSVSAIQNVLYTAIMAFTKSDHKPITAMLLLPSPSSSAASASTGVPPLIQLPPAHLNLRPHKTHQLLTRLVGKPLDLIVGYIWMLLWLIGAGHAGVGVGSFVLGSGALVWWTKFA